VPRERKPGVYRRNYGVIWRPGALGEPDRPRRRLRGAWINDGGEDAPLSPRGRFIYHWIIGGIVVVGVGLFVLFR
jgi:hypothetical protein